MTILPLKNVKTGDPQRSGTFPDWGWVVWIFGHPLKVRLEKKSATGKQEDVELKKTNKKNTVCWWTVRVRQGGVGDDGTCFQWGGGHTATYSTALTRACFFDWPGPWLTPPALFFFFFFLAALKMAAGSVPVSSVPFPTLLLSPWWWLQQQPAWQWGLSEAGG